MALQLKANPSSPDRGAEVYQTCVPCHGAQGEGLESRQTPRLAGRESWFVQRQLALFRQRERGRDESETKGYLPPPDRTLRMHDVVDSLNPTDTRELIVFLGKLPTPPIPPPRLGSPELGRPLFRKCIPCHGERGGGDRKKEAPRLTGQPEWYLSSQLQDFRMGWRGIGSSNPHVKLMREQMDLGDRALTDLTAYLVSLNTPPPAKEPDRAKSPSEK